MSDADVIVVGAGPAGSIAALTLARTGARVLLLDRAEFPRDKLCGDTLNPGSLALLTRIAGERVMGPLRRRALSITGMQVTGPGGASVIADYPGPVCGLAMPRRDLDALLVEEACHAGAHFEPRSRVLGPVTRSDGRVTGVRVASTRGTSTLVAGVIIAADGRASRLASAARLAQFRRSPRRWAFGAYFAGVQGMTSRGEMHVRNDGYVGIAPLPAGMTNVCVVRALPRAGSNGIDEQKVIADTLATDRRFGGRFATATRISRVTTLGPLAVDSSAAGCAGMLLAGDAAGFIDPVTGDGLRFAIRGGELAAQWALRELESGVASHQQLAAARLAEFHGKWRFNRGLRSLLASPLAVAAAAVASRAWAAPVRRLVTIAGDVS